MSAPDLTLADITIHRIIEDEFPFLPVTTMLPAVEEDILKANRPWLTPHALDDQDYVIICIQSYLVRTPHHTILIDGCIGNDKTSPFFPQFHQRRSDRFEQALLAADSSFEDIDYVMCTHLHSDHVGWNTRLQNGVWVPSFPKARYIFSKTEYDHVLAGQVSESTSMYRESVLPVVNAKRADIVTNDFTIGDHVRLLPTPGHTPGHVAISFGKSGDEAIMTGDLLHSPLQIRYPHLSAVFDDDPVQSALTRQNFLARYCDTETRCCFGHISAPAIGKIKRWGHGFRCV